MLLAASVAVPDGIDILDNLGVSHPQALGSQGRLGFLCIQPLRALHSGRDTSSSTQLEGAKPQQQMQQERLAPLALSLPPPASHEQQQYANIVAIEPPPLGCANGGGGG